MTEAVIVSAVRTPVGKAPGGTLRTTRPDELASSRPRSVTVITSDLRVSRISIREFSLHAGSQPGSAVT